VRVAADWLTNLVSRPIAAQLGLVDRRAAQLEREQAGSGAAG
jgi:NADH dehydrogenase